MTRIAFEAAIADCTERLDAARQKGEEMIRNFQALVTEQEVLEGEIHCLAQGFEWGLAAHDPEEAPRETLMTEPRSAAIEAAQIITPRFITKLVELNPTFSARVAIEENLRADIVSAIEWARREGWEAGREECAKWHDDLMDCAAAEENYTLVRFHCDSAEIIRALTPPSQEGGKGE